MMVVTAKVKKKNLLIVAAAIIGILLILLWPGKKNEAPNTETTNVADNSDRVSFLESFGWQVNPEPMETGRVRVPQEENEIFVRYNKLQQSQGYDLRQYAGKIIDRYVYEITNGPQEGELCKATVFVYKDQIVGGDISCAGPGGKMHGFRMP